MKAIFERSYVKSGTGNDVYVYSVEGTDTELANYKKAQGKNYREDKESGKALWFSSRYSGEVADLIITSKGSVIADMSEMRKQASLVAQFGGNLGQAMAEAAAAKLLGNKKPVASTPTTEPEATAEPDGLDKL